MKTIFRCFLVGFLPFAFTGCVTLEGGVYGTASGNPQWGLTVKVPLIPSFVKPVPEPEEPDIPIVIQK